MMTDDDWVGPVAVIIILLVIAFWGFVGAVALHFIAKWW